MKNLGYILILLILTSCFQKKSFLSDEIKQFIPYKENQELVFVSDKNVENFICIKSIEDNKFGDGIPPSRREILDVYGVRKIDSTNDLRHQNLLTGIAKSEKKEELIIFEIDLSTGGMKHRVPFSKVDNRKLIKFKTRFTEYDDVIRFKFDYARKPNDSEITEFYWSLSKGYVRLIQQDKTSWDLKSINNC